MNGVAGTSPQLIKDLARLPGAKSHRRPFLAKAAVSGRPPFPRKETQGRKDALKGLQSPQKQTLCVAVTIQPYLACNTAAAFQMSPCSEDLFRDSLCVSLRAETRSQ